MASSNETSRLGLNQWVGTDKPKMTDFNADNAKIDAALSAHLSDAAAHSTAAERAAWDAAVPVVGSYAGDGESSRTIELGFSPSFGMVFAQNKALLGLNPSTGDVIYYFTLLSRLGSSMNAQAAENGFTIRNLPGSTNSRIFLLNDASTTYTYLMFR